MSEDMNPANQQSEDGSEYRIQRILGKTRMEVGTRDVMTFAFGKAWSVLLIVGATFVVAADHWSRSND